jgi:hypothetical protein
MARPAKLERLRDRAMHSRTRAQRAYWKRSLARNRKKHLTTTVAFDGVPTQRGLALLLGHARRHGWKGRLSSSDRRKGVAERYGHQSQSALYDGFRKGLPGFNPANPPGFSSHELRSDGTHLFGARGRKLPWFKMGLDVSDDAALQRELRELGVHVKHPYDTPSEAHHLNVLADPTDVLAGLGDV